MSITRKSRAFKDISLSFSPHPVTKDLPVLTNDDEYTGGDLEFADFDDSTYKFSVPKSRGTVIVFDSRTPHRVLPIKSGVRKSLVGWVVGKRWR